MGLAACLACLTFIATAQTTVTRPAMGTPWTVTVYAADTTQARRAIDSAFARIEAIEQVASDYRADSELNQLTRLPVRQYHRVSDDLLHLLTVSLELSRHSAGAFDPTVGPLTKLWRRAIRQQQFPTEQAIAAARTRVGSKHVRLRRGGRVRLARDSMQLDLGGIAKGYALDAAGAVLQHLGITSYLIDGGGDLLLGAPPTGRASWRVTTPAGPVDTSRVAIATSGASYRYLEHDGRRYSHIVDPRTGVGVTRPESVTVFAPTATVADGLASALSVLDQRRAQRLLRHYPGAFHLRPRPLSLVSPAGSLRRRAWAATPRRRASASRPCRKSP